MIDNWFKVSLSLSCAFFVLWFGTTMWPSTGLILHALFVVSIAFGCGASFAYVHGKCSGRKYSSDDICSIGGGFVLCIGWLVWPLVSMWLSKSGYSIVCWSFGSCATATALLSPFVLKRKKELALKEQKEREYWDKIRKENEQRRAEQERIAQEQARQEEERRKREEALRREKEEQERRRRQESIRNMHSQAASDCMETGSQNPSGDSWESFFSRK